MPKKFYLTTAIDYVNNLPHLGTAYEKIGADVIARYFRMEGIPVHFQMGSDEHSASVKKEALKRGLPPKVYCNGMREEFTKIWRSLEISQDDFIQTSEPRHHQAVQELFQSILKKGDIYKSPYEGWYCESCEAFFTDKDLSNGKCPAHKVEPKWLKEKNYFFRLSAYKDKLLSHYTKHPEFILPEIRRNEILRLVEGGLQDVSISRSSFDWGIPLPIDSSHVVYVWFDALINYLTAVGFGQKSAREKARLKRWWPADLHIIGKDITRFHCVIWPAMLMSAGLPLPKTVFGHGFVFLKGEKMSKTLGNIVTPLDIIPRFGADALRYYLLRDTSFGSDGDFTWENFVRRYNFDLANDLGNLLNRTLGMTHKYLGENIRPIREVDSSLKKSVAEALKNLRGAMDYRKNGDINFHLALEGIWEVIHTADKFIDQSAPWVLAKEGKTKEIEKVLFQVIDTLRNIAILIIPFLPQTSREIWNQLGLSQKVKWEKQTFRNIAMGKTPAVRVLVGNPIFPRIELSPTTANKEAPSPLAPRGEGGSNNREENVMDLLDISDFQKIDLRVAEVKSAEKVEGADKLLKLQIELGGETRQIVAGIAQHYTSEQILGKKIIIVTNLKPAKIRGVESNGMLLAASNDKGLSIVTLDRPLDPGAKVK
ncbi:MAG: methionine--tRNA ligase [Deltaproteobacteria bacterium]|nr:methionine--tRNA ligase [Deltaproteobacteria bacterium]MBI2501295.1 methionine--tRNA ligase [Deltaproteobacteria bacterium]